MKRILLIAALLSGCASAPQGNPALDSYNKTEESQFSPVRARFTDKGNGATATEFGVWAGEAGQSVATGALRDNIFRSFQDGCGFPPTALKEVRVVKHAPPLWYEVWVFHDAKSQRPDKTSGMSVVLRFDQASNQTQVSFYGACK